MGFLDRAKEAAQRARSGARVAREQGQHRINELQARRQAEVLLREVGLASYEEKQGVGGQEAVVRAVAKLDEHVRAHNIDLSTSGLRGYLRTATGAGDDGRVGRPPAGTTTDASTADEPGATDTPPSSTAEQPAPEESNTSDESGEATASAAESVSKQSAAKKTTTNKSSAAKKSTSTKKTSSAKKTSTAKKTTTKNTAAKKTTSADAKPPADGDQ